MLLLLLLVWVVPASLGSVPLLPAYVAPSLSFRKLFLLPLAFVGLRLGRVSFACSFWLVLSPSFAFLLLVSPSFVPDCVQAGLCCLKGAVEVLSKQDVKVTKAAVTGQVQPHIVTDIAFQAVHNCRKLNEVRNPISRKLLIPDHLLLASIVLLQERSWFRIKARSHEALEKLEVVTPLASGEKQVELPPSFPAIGGLKPHLLT